MNKKKCDEEIPSLFILCSPFQVMCAKEAIEEFHIRDYSIHILISDEMSYRDKQMLHLLDTLELSYKTFHYRVSNLKYERIKIFKYQFSKFNRAFIGDFRDMRLVYTAFKLISNGGTIFFLDDGSINISLLKGTFTFPQKLKYKLPFWAAKVRAIRYNKDLFTLYADIKNEKYKLYLNSLKYFSRNHSITKEGIYIIGTNPKEYVVGFNISLAQFEESMEKIIIRIKKEYPQDIIHYVAHGSDNSSFTSRICYNHMIDYIRPQEMVEAYLSQSKNTPKKIIGFTSSALFNLKMIFPNTEIINYLYYTQTNEVYNSISSYYLSHGIKLKLFH